MPKIKTKNSFSHKLLKILAVGGATIVAASNPYFGLKIFGNIEKELKVKRWRQFYNNIYGLKRQNKISVLQNPNGSYSLNITELGKKIVKKYDLDALEIIKPEQWDGCWRLVSFDIPANKKMARYSFLHKLKEFGFIMAQRSLWVHPYECRNELAVIAKAFEIEQYIHTFLVQDADKDFLLREKFNKVSGIILSAS